MDASFQLLRTVQMAMLVSIAFYVWLANRFGPPPKQLPPAIFFAITGVGIVISGAVFLVRGRMVIPSATLLARNPDDSVALKRWRADTS